MLKHRHIPFIPVLLVVSIGNLDAQRYEPGDIVENITLTNRATGEAVNLYDLEGKVLFLEWFAYWCPFCKAAAAEVGPEIVNYYRTRGGNPDGVEVMHVALNLEPTSPASTDSFINFYGIEYVLNDFSRQFANRFQGGGQPIFAVINGVADSASHEQWELVYSRLGYGDLTHPIDEFRSAINSVQAAPEISYEKFVADTGFAENQKGEMEDPDFDGVINLFEYLAGTEALDTSSFFRPKSRVVSVTGENFQALEYVAVANMSDLSLAVQFSHDPDFSVLNTSIPFSTEPMGGGLERVIVRSGTPMDSMPEFARLRVNRIEEQN